MSYQNGIWWFFKRLNWRRRASCKIMSLQNVISMTVFSCWYNSWMKTLKDYIHFTWPNNKTNIFISKFQCFHRLKWTAQWQTSSVIKYSSRKKKGKRNHVYFRFAPFWNLLKSFQQVKENKNYKMNQMNVCWAILSAS